MSLGNIHSSVRGAPSNNAWVLVALLPCPPSCSSNNSAELSEYQTVKANNLHAILANLLAPVLDIGSNGVPIRCADGLTRLGFPKTCAWLADYLEYTKLLNLENAGCPVCEVTVAHLGQYKEPGCPALALSETTEASFDKSPEKPAPTREWDEYRVRSADYIRRKTQETAQPPGRKRKGAETALLRSQIRAQARWFKERKAKPVWTSLWDLDGRLQTSSPRAEDMEWEDDTEAMEDTDTSMLHGSLWKPDILHTLYLGMLKHIMDWLLPFLKRHRRSDKFDDAWKKVPPFPGMYQPKKAYR